MLMESLQDMWGWRPKKKKFYKTEKGDILSVADDERLSTLRFVPPR